MHSFQTKKLTLRNIDSNQTCTTKRSSLTPQQNNQICRSSLTPKPFRIKTSSKKQTIDMTSTSIPIKTTSFTENECYELRKTKEELTNAKLELCKTVHEYQAKLENAQNIIVLLREEMKNQLREFRDVVLSQKTGLTDVESLQVKMKTMQEIYEKKIGELEKEKLCLKCKAFVGVASEIEEKKKLYNYLY
ncbi:hypothetical protein SteCoe_30573 [Stentor coeruleus]|uniref:Uncharacterized protein n=1 Tax=Stentor coeruleus TaxID=5963 RepID=A0A1R2B3B1_9CILI|nr:hypothetical protein SteCoe_30573 [Stentor coeruleus]